MVRAENKTMSQLRRIVLKMHPHEKETLPKGKARRNEGST